MRLREIFNKLRRMWWTKKIISHFLNQFPHKRVSFGKGHIDVYTLHEDKNNGSAYIHVFNTIEQDRFHTHSFDGYSVMIKGGYREQYKEDGIIKEKWIGPGVRFIPKDYNHRLMESMPNTVTILIAGPWDESWTEEKDGIITHLGWGRNILDKEKEENNGNNGSDG